MSDGRTNVCTRQNGCNGNEKVSIGSLWIDYHGTIAYRRAGALKRAAEKALGHSFPLTGEEVNQLVERVRLEFDEKPFFKELDGPTRWVMINRHAFNCTAEQASRMSELVQDESNYRVSKKRLEFVLWLLKRFPSNTSGGKCVLTASNAPFLTVRRFVEARGLEGVTPVSAELMAVYKPNDEFWSRLFDVTKVPPEKTLFIANSWRNDLAAACRGVNVIIILPPSVTLSGAEILGKIGKVSGRVFVVRSLREAREVVERNFVQIR